MVYWADDMSENALACERILDIAGQWILYLVLCPVAGFWGLASLR